MRKSWIALIAIIAVGFAWSFAGITASPARADDASLAAAQELVDYTLGKSTDDMISKMEAAIWSNLETAFPRTTDAATIAEMRGEFDTIVRRYVAQAMKIAPTIYAQHFTADELKGLLAFYKTPLGDKMLAEMPKVMGDFTSTAMIPMMAPMQSEIKASLETIMRKQGTAK